jgi:hypothetical protein
MVAGSVGSSAVVVPDVGRECHTHVPLIEDQHAVGEFGSQGADESFGETVGPRRQLHLIPTIGIAASG